MLRIKSFTIRSIWFDNRSDVVWFIITVTSLHPRLIISNIQLPKTVLSSSLLNCQQNSDDDQPFYFYFIKGVT